MKLFFDTETTSKNPKTAHLVQLGMVAEDKDYVERAIVSFIVRPENWKIPDEVVKIHGITQEMAEEFGVKLHAACRLFYSLVRQSDILIGHNISYDMGVMEFAFALIGQQENWQYVASKKQFCTMKSSTDFCRLPNIKFPGSFKWPTLTEAHKHFFGEGFEGAHSALADVQASRRIFTHLTRDLGVMP